MSGLATPSAVERLEEELARTRARLADSERRVSRMQACVDQLRTRDPVTGLPNRGRLVAGLQAALAGRGPVAVLQVGLDAFRAVNDSLGRDAGDRVLAAVAERLAGCASHRALVARGDGDEFAIAVRASRAAAGQFAERVLEALRRPFAARPRGLRLSASIGIATGPRDGRDPAALLAAAGWALRCAKEEARRGYRYFTPPAPGAAARLDLQSELARAVERNEFVFHYQPKVELATARLTGVEALVRWRHPQRGIVLPGEFLATAESLGLTAEMTGEAVRCALAQLAAWDREGIRVPSVAVNLSAPQFGHPRLADLVASGLERYRIAPGRLHLEITETAMLRFEGRTAANLGRLEALGVALALDDFGTGYSNLAYLRRLPIAQLKLDRSFVADLGGPADSFSLVKAIVGMAAGLGMRVVAEGIERESQRAALHALGCDEGQGHLFAPALPPRALAAFAGYRPGTGKATSLGSKANGSSRAVSTVTRTQPIAGPPCVSSLVMPHTG